METLRPTMRRHSTGLLLAALLVGAAPTRLHAASDPPAGLDEPPARLAPLGLDAPLPPPARHDVRVQLVFGEDADLDLFVTDPSHEEIYFGNSPGRLGGVFDVDRRCGDPAPRVETVRFAPAPSGRYRVSVDYMIRCRSGVDEVPYRVVVDANGERHEVEGTARFGVLEHIVIEFEARPEDGPPMEGEQR